MRLVRAALALIFVVGAAAPVFAADAVLSGIRPPSLPPVPYEKEIRTPPAAKGPRINGPKVYGVRPGSPFIFRIPATGVRPMHFAVKDLPGGLTCSADTGIITGAVTSRDKKTYTTTVTAENAAGKAEREFRIVVGDTLALTPPMGWNHWYMHYDKITDALMRQAADMMVSSGMADVGYQYVDIDDCWPNAAKQRDPKRVGPLRDANGDVVPNAYFPDMKALTEYIHSKGLKAGIYTSPGSTTCAGFAGSYKHEEQDARKYAAWGFDFLKYDWCSYGMIAKDKSLEEMKKPYAQMGAILKTMPRDIVFNLCQYGMGDVWNWGEEVGGNCWRTSGDLGGELERFHPVAIANAAHHKNARPGAWNDPDYLLLGYIGDDGAPGGAKPCPLKPNEQYSYMSLWCLMASPLFFSGDMSRLDAFTLNVLCNAEVIDIDQDALGKQGFPVVKKNGFEVWTKPLEDGSIAVGLFNTAKAERSVTAKWEDIGVKGPQSVRDLWRQRDLGVSKESFSANVGGGGVVLVRMTASR